MIRPPTAPPRRRTAVAAALVFVLAGLAACGSDSSKDEGSKPHASAEAVNIAQQKVLQARSAKVSGSVKVALLPETLEMEGVISWEKRPTGELRVKNPSGTNDTTALITEDAAYVSFGGDFDFPQLPSTPDLPGLPSTKNVRWLKLSLDNLGEGNATGKVLRNELHYNNPARAIALMRQAGDIKQVGTETKNGVDTRHFSGRVEIAKLVADHKVGLTEQDIEAFRQEQAALGVKFQQIDIWLNDQELPVHIELSADSKHGSVEFSGDYSDFGVEVNVQAPPDSEVFDIGKLQQDLQKLPSAGEFGNPPLGNPYGD